MQTEQLFCWSGVTDTEHTTASSNEEDVHFDLRFVAETGPRKLVTTG